MKSRALETETCFRKITLRVYLVDGEALNPLVVAVATQQQLDQVVDRRPLRYQ